MIMIGQTKGEEYAILIDSQFDYLRDTYDPGARDSHIVRIPTHITKYVEESATDSEQV